MGRLKRRVVHVGLDIVRECSEWARLLILTGFDHVCVAGRSPLA